jgi:hypothetical protein
MGDVPLDGKSSPLFLCFLFPFLSSGFWVGSADGRWNSFSLAHWREMGWECAMCCDLDTPPLIFLHTLFLIIIIIAFGFGLVCFAVMWWVRRKVEGEG